jgi:hypothetical protein
MHRRNLLVGSTLAGVGGAALAGCAPSLAVPLLGSNEVGPNGLLDPKEVEARWRLVEQSRAAIAARPRMRLDTVFRDGRSAGRVSRSDDVARKAAQSLLLSGAFRDLPEEARAHPTVQASMIGAMSQFDEAMFGMKDRLDKLTPTEQADIAREFRRDPELAERVVTLLDAEAEQTGVSETRRLHMRRIGLTICNRLHQSSELLIGEYSTKMQKAVERHGSDAEIERKIAAAMGDKAFAAMRERTIRAAESYRTFEVAGAQRIRGTDGTAPGADPNAMSSTKVTVLTVGGVFLGLGVVSGIIGGIVIATGGIAGAFVLTAGGVFLLVGLIMMIVGAASD